MSPKAGTVCWLLLMLIFCRDVGAVPQPKDAGVPAGDDGDALASELRGLDSLFTSFYPWLAGLFDPRSGGFYYARSSLEDTAKFRPDIESSAQAIGIINSSKLVGSLDRALRGKMIGFFRMRQDISTGFFCDAHINTCRNERMRSRALGYSTKVFRWFEASPPFPTPGSRKGSSHLPAFLENQGRLLKWLEDRNWENSWKAMDHISSQGALISSLPENKRLVLLNTIFTFLDQKQDSTSGFWGGGKPADLVSGAFKAALFYERFRQPIPRADLILENTLRYLPDLPSERITSLRNPLQLIRVLRPSLSKPLSLEARVGILRVCVPRLAAFLQPDGGFSGSADGSLASPNGYMLGMGKKEGDMNASTQALLIRNILVVDMAGQQFYPPKGSEILVSLLTARMK